jgi:alpha-galactosidase
MAGVLGIGANLLGWDDATRRRAAALVLLYKRIRRTVHTGIVTAHGHPDASHYALAYVAPDAAQAVILAYRGPKTIAPSTSPTSLPTSLPTGAAHTLFSVPIPGLDPAARYRRDDGTVLTGRDLAIGVPVPFTLAADADVVVLDRIELDRIDLDPIDVDRVDRIEPHRIDR